METVKKHTDFACFEYTNQTENWLGEVVINTYEASNKMHFGDLLNDYQTPEIGVIIQTHEYGEFRTDMWGNDSFYNTDVRYATLEEINAYRPELTPHLKSTK